LAPLITIFIFQLQFAETQGKNSFAGKRQKEPLLSTPSAFFDRAVTVGALFPAKYPRLLPCKYLLSCAGPQR
ncbi:hypothetical protein, partial [Hungatella sp.]|uniref:hypothetical protein n=1 Tax=Hungatella sp. TaxID=2613924 RepID=UPI002A81DDFC